MRILLTNDDGIGSPALPLLKEALEKKGHEVWTVAPKENQSATSHSITLSTPLVLKSIGERVYWCAGTPVDCVNCSVFHLFKENKLDVIVSGINLGYNLGNDLVCSGTAAAARQGALYGIPSIALSWGLSNEREIMDRVSSQEIKELLEVDLRWMANRFAHRFSELLGMMKPSSFMNINFPKERAKKIKWSPTDLGDRDYQNKIESFRSPTGEEYCFISGFIDESRVQKGSDTEAVFEGNIAYSIVECLFRESVQRELLKEFEDEPNT